jgi:hypothetical protein
MREDLLNMNYILQAFNSKTQTQVSVFLLLNRTLRTSEQSNNLNLLLTLRHMKKGKKLSLVFIAFTLFNWMQAQTTPKGTRSGGSKTRNSRSISGQHQTSRRDSTQSPKGYYKREKDMMGKDSNKIGAMPK